ncbi:ABC transporter permease [Streptomyces montanisoli]|uniref:ABC transporter permease n=1 Tax=Streptomyces montanisoli TaxID=2798581 RepID=A0A940M7Q6_9ACTN|nr:ABC transporter permease [Streptomyces montanisoli]MBP0457739.1 ABC transporter permease [Streptomyces montanisoli]
MAAYIIRRVFAAVLLLLVVSAVTFAIFYLLPRAAGQSIQSMAAQYVGKSPDPDVIKAVIKNLGLDQPIYEQYWHFIKGLVAGANYSFGPDPAHCSAPCFGYSFKTHTAVWPQIQQRAPITFSLAIGAAVIWLITGISTGILSALKRGSIWDRLAMGISLMGVSLPMFFTGLALLALFSFNWLHIWNVHYVSFVDNPAQWAWNLILPWVSLAFLYSALYARLTRAGMLETMGEDYIRTARAKGLVERKVIVKHGLRSALTPLITIFGMDFALLLGGAVITESVFSFQGLGAYAIQGVTDNDLPIVMGVTLLTAFFIVVCNLLVDLVYAAIDPRVRLS